MTHNLKMPHLPNRRTWTWTGWFAMAVPVTFTLGFGILSKFFGYPQVLNQDPSVVFTAWSQQPQQAYYWGLTMLASIMFMALCPMVLNLLGRDNFWLKVTTITGILGGLCQTLDLSLWTLMMPHWSERVLGLDQSSAAYQSQMEIYWSLHELFGNVIGLQLATFFNGLWAYGVGCSMLQIKGFPKIAGRAGQAAGILFLLSLVPQGFKFWALVNTLGFAIWSLWLGILGLVLVKLGK